MLLPIENPQGVTVHLDAGMQLGSVQALPSPPLEPQGTPEGDCASSSTSTVKASTHTPEHLPALMQVLGLPLEKLSAEEGKQL